MTIYGLKKKGRAKNKQRSKINQQKGIPKIHQSDTIKHCTLTTQNLEIKKQRNEKNKEKSSKRPQKTQNFGRLKRKLHGNQLSLREPS